MFDINVLHFVITTNTIKFSYFYLMNLFHFSIFLKSPSPLKAKNTENTIDPYPIINLFPHKTQKKDRASPLRTPARIPHALYPPYPGNAALDIPVYGFLYLYLIPHPQSLLPKRPPQSDSQTVLSSHAIHPFSHSYL